MTTQIIHYLPQNEEAKKLRPEGVKLIVNMQTYEHNARFNGMPLTFLGFVNFMGKWDTMEKCDP